MSNLTKTRYKTYNNIQKRQNSQEYKTFRDKILRFRSTDHDMYPGGFTSIESQLFIKGKNEHHKNLIVSNKSISYSNLQDCFVDLLNN